MKTILRWLACLTILALFFALLVPVAHAQPAIPHTFYGTVKINGSDASVATTITAKVGGVACGSYTTTEVGKYGNLAEAKHLVVQGDIDEGATINFYVKGVDTTQTASFIPGGGPTVKNLTVTITVPPAVGGGGGAPPAGPATVEASLFGETVEFSIDNDGVIQETIEATSEDGNLTITIPEDTIALDKDGDPLDSLEATVDESPPDPPEDAHIIGLAYDFGPDGATFDPAITLTWTYDPDDLPQDVAEEDLVIAYYDQAAGEWVEVDCVVDTENNTITASVEHLTTFAIIGTVTPAPPPPPPPAPAAFSVTNLSIKPAEVKPKEPVTISVSIANTGGTEGSYTAVLKINGVKEVEKRVTLAAGSTEMWFLFVEREEAGSYSVVVDGLSASFAVIAPPAPPPPPPPPVVPPEVRPPVNWPVLGAVIGVVIAIGLLIFLLVRRRA
ncbi:hypothetical protein ES706_06363 [subsurface metagenome]